MLFRAAKGLPVPHQADVLLIGEAPGLSEDGLGKPFLGPAGLRFDDIMASVHDRIGQFSWVVTNSLACAPYDEDNSIGKPKQAHHKACMPRVIELLHILKPKCVILLGNEAEKAWNIIHAVNFKRKHPFESVPAVKVAHPSWIEHYCSDPDLEHKRAVLTMSTFIARHVDTLVVQ